MLEWYEIKDEDYVNHEQTKSKSETKGFVKWIGWISENIGPIIVLAPICITGVTLVARTVAQTFTSGVKGLIKNANLRKEEKIKDLYCYDHSLGHYWRLKRKLTNSEWVEIDKRKRNGERLSDILNDMKVLY